MNIIDKFHLIRRGLLIVFTYFFLRVTNHILFDSTASDTIKISVYISFAGIITFMIKWYHDTRDKEIK